MWARLFSTGLLLLATQPLAKADGPFGVTMGSKIGEYSDCQPAPTSPGQYFCATLPRPHADMENYLIKAFPDLGICIVAGFTKPITVNSFGDELRRQVDDLKNQLIVKYGPPTQKNDDVAGLFTSPHEWMFALQRNERRYGYVWKNDLPDGIGTVIVNAAPTDHGLGEAVVIFQSQKKEECSAAEKNVKAGAF
jgi:hypothetical protein